MADFEAGLTEMFNRLVTMPMPRAIDPMITIAQNLDTVALGGLQIACGEKRKQLELEDIGADRRTVLRNRRRHRALNRLISKLNAIKQERSRREREEEEQGWDPFFAAFRLESPLRINARTRLVADLEPGGTAGASEIVLPRYLGGATVSAGVTGGSADFDIGLGRNPRALSLRLADLKLDLESFEIAPGVMSGPGRIRIRDGASRRQSGTFDPASGLFDLYFEGQITNGVFDASEPIAIFVHASGGLSSWGCRVQVNADDPMLVPRPPANRTVGSPSLSLATRLAYDHRRRTVMLMPHIPTRTNPTVGSVRLWDGSRVADPLIGQPIRLGALIVRNATPERLEFEATAIIVGRGSPERLEGVLTDVVLDVANGSFDGQVTWNQITTGPSTAVADLERFNGPFHASLSSPVGVYDLAAATHRFTRSAWAPYLDLAHLFG